MVQERLGHSSIATTLDIYSHTVPGLQKAAAERIDALLPVQQKEKNVSKMLANGQEVESEPSGIRTPDTLIKSHGVIDLDTKGGEVNLFDTLIRLDTLIFSSGAGSEPTRKIWEVETRHVNNEKAKQGLQIN